MEMKVVSKKTYTEYAVEIPKRSDKLNYPMADPGPGYSRKVVIGGWTKESSAKRELARQQECYQSHYIGYLSLAIIDLDRNTPDMEEISVQEYIRKNHLITFLHEVGYDIPEPNTYEELKDTLKKRLADFKFLRDNMSIVSRDVFELIEVSEWVDA